jgi:hypothetical protein
MGKSWTFSAGFCILTLMSEGFFNLRHFSAFKALKAFNLSSGG